MATNRRSVSWLSLSSVRRPTTAPTPPPARSDPIRPPAFKPFRTLSSAQPQKPTWPPTAIGAAEAEQRAQTPQPPPEQRPPLFRSSTAAAKPPPQPAAAPISLQPPPAAAAAQRSSPPPTLTITSSAVSNAPKAPTTTSPALKPSQPIAAASFPKSPITTNLSSSPSTILQQFNNSSAETEHKSLLVQQVTEKSNQMQPNSSHVDTKHHKLQSTAQIAKTGVAFEEKAVAMQRKHLDDSSSKKHHGMRIVRLVGDNIGAAMVVNRSRNKYDHGAKLPSIQDKKTSTLFMNSNVQGVNNSIAFDSCLTHHNPGLHVCTFEP
nr:vegetative cell wall protein gp1 [Ipomoea batatas]